MGFSAALANARAAQTAQAGDPPCPGCGSGRHGRAIVTKDTRFASGAVGRFVECSDCGLLYLWPRPEALSILYEAHYEEPTIRVPAPEHRLSSRLSRLGRMACGEYAVPKLEPQTFFLDIGCGDGAALHQAMQPGVTAIGLEIDQARVSALRRRGLDVRHQALGTTISLHERFDLIWLSQVIEHVEKPLELLGFCRDHLTDAGELWVWCPNGRSLLRRVFNENWSGWYVPFHLFVFDEGSLTSLANKVGLRVLSKSTVTPSTFILASLLAPFPALRRAINTEWSLFRRALMLAVSPFGRVIDVLFPSRGDCLLLRLTRRRDAWGIK
jgi:SAM-dependent methyltransferase